MKTKNSSDKMLHPVLAILPILCVCEKACMIHKTVDRAIVIRNLYWQHLKINCTTAFSNKSY